MLLRKIRAVGILIFSALMMLCCSKRYDPSFFKGEWLSDSLVTKENDHWREFLYFDNDRAARTTAWGRQYVLNKNLRVKGLQLYNNDKALFRIKVIDSNKIIVEGKNYYASFVRNDHALDNMKTALAITEETEKQRKKLLGQWRIISFKTLALSELPEEKIIADHMQDEELENIPLKKIKSINFKYNEFIFQFGNQTASFEYTASPDNIEFYSGDAIPSFMYHFQKDQLVIEYPKTMRFLHVLTFEKVR